MPGAHAHLGQAEHNLRLYESMDRATYSDWAATVLFYSALHYVDAFLASLPTGACNPSGHADRDRYVNKIDVLKRIRVNYRALKDGCHNARYVPPTRFKPAELTHMKDENLAKIVAAVKPHIAAA